MTRVTYGPPSRQKKNRRLKLARGYRGGRSRLWRTASETLLRAWAYASRDRRTRKRVFRAMWIVRLNAATRMRGMPYSQFIDGLRKAKIELNRKQLSEIAINDASAFDSLVAEARAARG
jgi:large subunit ribosomal protein L20